MDALTFAIYFIALIVLLILAGRYIPRKVVIFEYEKGLKYSKGRFVKTLGPGVHYHFTHQRITKVDAREHVFPVPGQEVLCADGIPVRLTLAIGYKVAQPELAINEVTSYHQSLYARLQLGLRAAVSALPVDELLEKRGEIGPSVLEAAREDVAGFGLELTTVDVKDITFSAQIKKIFSEELAAKKAGLAALERARAETASLRNLANAAKAFDKNPHLMKLRLIQAFSESEGNTLVLNLSDDEAPAVVKVRR